MPTESILFAPEIDERELDKQTDAVNEQLAGVGEDIPVNFEGDMDGLTPAGDGGGMGGGLGGAAGATGVAGLASKIPKPVAGVTAAAALPIALSGGVGLGMLSAMQSSSARLQTSSKLLGIAVDNFFREPGNVLDQAIVRPLAKSILDMSLEWDEGLREFSSTLGGGILPDSFEQAGKRMSGVGEAIGAIPITWISTFGTGMKRLGNRIENFTLPDFPGWPSIPSPPDWSNLRPAMPDFSSLDLNLPGWLERWTSGTVGVDEGNTTIPDNNGGGGPGGSPFGGGGSGPGMGGGGGGGGGSLAEGSNDALVRMASGGRVTQTGMAEVHRGELVSDPDRLVSELASAVSTATGGGTRRGGDMDTGEVARKLDRLHDDLRRLESALSIEVQLGEETIARAASNGERNGIADSNPRV